MFQCQNGIIPRSNVIIRKFFETLDQAFQCQNGIIPRSNSPAFHPGMPHAHVFQCQNGIIPRSNGDKMVGEGDLSVRFNARTALSLVRTRFALQMGLKMGQGVSMPERHYPSFEHGETMLAAGGFYLVSMPERHYPSFERKETNSYGRPRLSRFNARTALSLVRTMRKLMDENGGNECFNARTALSLVRTSNMKYPSSGFQSRFNARTALKV